MLRTVPAGHTGNKVDSPGRQFVSRNLVVEVVAPCRRTGRRVESEVLSGHALQETLEPRAGQRG